MKLREFFENDIIYLSGSFHYYEGSTLWEKV